MSHQVNIDRIKSVHNALGTLNDQVVFVGGATVSLYVDMEASEVRPTEDVDILVEILTHREVDELEELLRSKGFEHDVTSKFKYRYKINGIIVDMMPMDEEVLGFSNYWYQDGFNNAVEYKIDELNSIKIFSPPYFIAAKLEAFKNRGGGDGRTSEDFEDIVYVLENRSSIWDELTNVSSKLRKYLVHEFKELQSNPHFEEWLDAHTVWGSPPASYMINEYLIRFTEGI